MRQDLDQFRPKENSLWTAQYNKCSHIFNLFKQILSPAGDKIERGTVTAERLYQSDRPRFPSDEAKILQPKPVPSQKLEEPVPCASRRGSTMPAKSRPPGKSGRKKVEEQKSENQILKYICAATLFFFKCGKLYKNYQSLKHANWKVSSCFDLSHFTGLHRYIPTLLYHLLIHHLWDTSLWLDVRASEAINFRGKPKVALY